MYIYYLVISRNIINFMYMSRTRVTCVHRLALALFPVSDKCPAYLRSLFKDSFIYGRIMERATFKIRRIRVTRLMLGLLEVARLNLSEYSLHTYFHHLILNNIS